MLTYGDGVCRRRPAASCSRFHRAHGRLATVTAVRPPARFGGLVFDGDLVRRVHREAADRRGLDQRRLLRLRAGSLRLPRRRRRAAWRPTSLERLAADGQLAAYRHDGFWQCMDTLRDKRLLEALWQDGRGARGRLAAVSAASGATGRPSSPAPPAWSAAGWSAGCSTPAPTSSAWCATGCRSPSWSARGLLERVKVVRGDVRDQALLERVARRVRDRHRLPPGGADDRPHRQPQPGLDLRDATSPAPGRCSRPAAAARASSRSCSPRPTRPTASSDELPYDEETPLQGRHPYDVSKSCADLIAQRLRRDLRPAGGDHALRQFLRRRRPELEPHRARHDPLGAARRAAGHPLRRPVHPRLLLRRGRRRRLHAAGRAAGGEPELRGEAFNFSNETQVTRARSWSSGSCALMGSTWSPTSATRRATRSATST